MKTIGMFTCDEEIGADATDLFNYLTGYSAKRDYRKLLVAPINLRRALEELIQREIEHQQGGCRGVLIFKMNALVDTADDPLLYQASQAGVKIDLIVRGMCCLRPGMHGHQREYPRDSSIVGPLPGAQPHLLLPQWRPGRDLPGQRRPDAAQHQPAGGGALPGTGPGFDSASYVKRCYQCI